jgi:hypothetical protein
VPVQNSGVGTQQLTAQTFTYNPNGYTLSIPAAYGATSYEWITQYGTISGNGTMVTLYSDYTTNVQVRAYNNRCQIYSSYDIETITINYGPISGSTLVCSSGSQYTVLNVPSGATITWSNGSYVNRVSSQGSNPCIFAATGSGSSWIAAQVTTTYGSKAVPTYSIWAGIPWLDYISGPSSGYTYTPYSYYTSPSRNSLSQSQYIWMVQPPGYNYYFNYQYYDWVTITFCDPYEYYMILTRATNTCGSSNWVYKNVAIYGGYFFFSASPNPASEEVRITATKENTEAVTMDIEVPEFNVQIFDLNGHLCYTDKKAGLYFTLPVNKLRNGSYLISISYGKQKESIPLIVKH